MSRAEGLEPTYLREEARVRDVLVISSPRDTLDTAVPWLHATAMIIPSPPKFAASCARFPAAAAGRLARQDRRGFRRYRLSVASGLRRGRHPARGGCLPLWAGPLHGGNERGARGLGTSAGANSCGDLQRQLVDYAPLGRSIRRPVALGHSRYHLAPRSHAGSSRHRRPRPDSL
jgi:hypothetical protein